MKRKFLYCAVAGGTVLLISLTCRGIGDAGRRGPGISGVTIDGSTFLPGGSLSEDVASLRRELSRLGVPASNGLDFPATTGGTGPVFSETLVASEKPFSGKPSPIPDELEADHAIRMDREDGTVELFMGRTASGVSSTADRLQKDRWEPVRTAGNLRLPRMLRKTGEKETSIVWLDEADRGFLLIRSRSR